MSRFSNHSRCKRSFILLEILIAFFLLALCAVPLVRQPLKLFSSEAKFLELMERERLADWSFTEVKEKLLKREIPWEKLPEKKKGVLTLSLPAASIEIPGLKNKIIERKFTLKCTAEKKGSNDEIYRLYLVSVDFLPKLFPKKPSHYTYRVLIQKKKEELTIEEKI